MLDPISALNTEFSTALYKDQITLKIPNKNNIKENYFFPKSISKPKFYKRYDNHISTEEIKFLKTENNKNKNLDKISNNIEFNSNSYSKKKVHKSFNNKTFKHMDKQNLKDLLHCYLQMGKEKWAGFLATSNSNKFKILLNTFKYELIEDTNIDSSHQNLTKATKSFASGIPENSLQSANGNDDYNRYDSNNNNDNNFTPNNYPSKELEDFKIMLHDVIDYWENEDAKTILKSAQNLTYEEFKLDDNHVYNINSKKYYKTISATDYVENNNAKIDHSLDQYTLKDATTTHKDLLENLNPDAIKTEKQKEWLKENALRRSFLLQSLLNGEFDEFDEFNFKQDTIRYRDGNIFLDQDENEFISEGFKIRCTYMAMYICFLAEIIFFQIF
jgi:hypothetical protein